MNEVFRKIEAICPAERGADMRQYTTFKIGGKADLLASPSSPEMLREVLSLCAFVPHSIIGNGSNLLVGDGGYRGVLIRIGNGMGNIERRGETIIAEAGASLAAVARTALEAGLCGMEPLSGIPGTVGGACVMNAGAYGGEMRDVVKSVSFLTKNGELCQAEDHGFSYRHSRYMEEEAVILSVEFSLKYGDRDAIREMMEQLSVKRREKQPLTMPSAGSAFRRPQNGYAAQMIDEAGLRGFSIGGAAVSEKHAGFVVNTGGATAKEVRALLTHIEETVFRKFGVRLEPEIRFLGEF